MKFCYNFTKHFIVGVRPFELAMGVELNQSMTLTIARIGRKHCKRSKNVEEMVKKCKS
jgi:hypothetical protein